MAKQQTEAQHLADHLESDDIGPVDHQAAALLRKQDELLRQALEALEAYQGFIDDAHILEGQFHWLDGIDATYAAMRNHLEAK